MLNLIDFETIRPLYNGADPIHDFDHVLRVTKMAQHIASAEGAKLDIVRAAALLHDIARADEDTHQAGDHALLASHQARQILANTNAKPDFIEAVVHAIAAHRFRNDIQPETLEAKVLFDADKLDAIGAIGVARAFAFGGILGQKLWGAVSPGYTPNDSEEHTAHHEFQYKLRHIQERFCTPTGRALAEQRHKFMVSFFEQMAAEVDGNR